MVNGIIYLTRADGVSDTWQTGLSMVTMIRPRTQGGYVVADHSSIWTAEQFGSALRWFGDVETRSDRRLNDGACAPDGSLLVGSMSTTGCAGSGALYRVSSGGTVDVIDKHVTTSNGVAFPSMDLVGFYVDSATRTIDQVSLDGRSASRTIWQHLPSDLGEAEADGICCDTQGGVWAAIWNGAQILRFADDGTLVGRIPVDVSRPTSCALGGPNGDTLFVTTSRTHDEPSSGSVFVVPSVGAFSAPVFGFGG